MFKNFIYPLFVAIGPAVMAQVNITVDWNEVKYAIDPHAFGLNGFQATSATNTHDAAYKNNMKYMLGTRNGGGMIRIHTWEMMGTGTYGWLNNDGTWNAAKIKNAVKGLVDAGHTVCINIPDGSTNANKVDNPSGFAQFCADLVKIVNINANLGVKYWEIPNERDEGRTGRQMAAIYNPAVIAMKAVDPSIKVGGPAYQFPHRETEVRSFIDAALKNLDFVSFHNYAGGGGMSDEDVWDAAAAQWYCEYISDYLAQKSPGRKIPLWYDEFNVGWSWDLAQAQQNGICGAIYDALTLSLSLDYGADVLCAWNEKDGSYGKMGNDNSLRPAAHVFHMFNAYVYGTRVRTTTSDNKKIVPFAALGSDGRHTLVLTNRTKLSQLVVVKFAGWSPGAHMSVFQLDDSGYAEKDPVSIEEMAGGMTLPAQSVTAITLLNEVTSARDMAIKYPLVNYRDVPGSLPLHVFNPLGRVDGGMPDAWRPICANGVVLIFSGRYLNRIIGR